MYSRHVMLNIEPNQREELTQRFERDILPLLQRQNGFVDEIVFLSPDQKSVLPSACGRAGKLRTPTAARSIPRCSRPWPESLKAPRKSGAAR